jgi:hypothetical protein
MLFKVLLSLIRLVLGTGRSFKIPPDRKYSRCVQDGKNIKCRQTERQLRHE